MLTPDQHKQLNTAIDELGTSTFSIFDLKHLLADLDLDLRVWIERRRVHVALTDEERRQANAVGDSLEATLAIALVEYRDRMLR